MNDLVSIIIPCYNYGSLLPETLGNIQKQSWADWEALIIDDGSTDDTAEIARRFAAGDSRFRYFRQENRGLSAARNAGLAQTRGGYIQFLDADDLLSPAKIRQQIHYMQAHEEVDISYTQCYYFADEEPGKLFPDYEMRNVEWMPKTSGRGETVIAALTERNIMPVNSPLLRKKVLEKVSGFDTGMKSLEDWDFWIKCALNDISFHYLDQSEAYALVRVHGSSMTRDAFKMKLYEINLREKMALHLQGREPSAGINHRIITELGKQLFRELVPADFPRLRALRQVMGWKKFLRQYFSALNYKRKNFFKTEKPSVDNNQRNAV